MAAANKIDVNFLHAMVLREAESDSVQELDPGFYRTLSEFLGDLERQEFDGVEDKIKRSMIATATELTELLVGMRLSKISAEKTQAGNLLDEEKFILDAHEQQAERTGMILSATLHGRSKLLESVSQKHKTQPVIVRFLQDVDEIVGADFEKYGPFKAEDIASIPYDNAQALITTNAATKVHWKD